MFGLFKSDPAKKLRKQYSAKLQEAMLAQRNGDIRSYATLSEEAQALWVQLEPLERGKP
jgi:predicted ATPase